MASEPAAGAASSPTASTAYMGQSNVMAEAGPSSFPSASTAADFFSPMVSAASSSTSLFSSDEAKFISDTFASAQSFDPFQQSANQGGFRVPAVLPPGLIQSLSAASSSGQGADGSSGTNGSTGSSASPSSQFAAMHNPPQPPLWGGQHMRASTSASGDDFHPRADRSRTNSWAPTSSQPYPHFGSHLNSMGTSNTAQQHSPFSQASNTRSQPLHLPNNSHSQSFSGHPQPFDGINAPWATQSSSSPSSANAALGRGGAYGQNRAWQLQQMEALQAERRRYMESLGGQTGQQGIDSISNVDNNTAQSGMSGPFAANGVGGLSNLAMSFPSSHNFPAPSPPNRTGLGKDADGDSDMALSNTSWGGPTWASIPSVLEGSSAMAQQTATQSKSSKISNANRRKSTAGAAKGRSSIRESTPSSEENASERLTRTDSGSNLYKPWPKAPSPCTPSIVYPSINVDPAKIPQSDLKNSLGKGKKAETERVLTAFYDRDPAEERRRFQPHLVDLKERRKEERSKRSEMMEEKKRKALERQRAAALAAGKDVSEVEVEVKEDAIDGKDGKKPQHTLLTEAEKKANHIASEQKRRANIRKGYEMLCAGIPALREEEENGGAGAVDGSDDEDEDADADGRQKKEDANDKLDARAGPRSEAVVLGKTVDHIRLLLEYQRDLRSRRDHARAKLAQAKVGVDILVAEAEKEADGEEEQKGKKRGGNGRGDDKGGKGRKGAAEKAAVKAKAPAPVKGKAALPKSTVAQDKAVEKSPTSQNVAADGCDGPSAQQSDGVKPESTAPSTDGIKKELVDGDGGEDSPTTPKAGQKPLASLSSGKDDVEMET